MTLKAIALTREFIYNGSRLPDPKPTMTVDQVRDVYAPMYPEIATASVDAGEVVGSVMRYTFTRAIGVKS